MDVPGIGYAWRVLTEAFHGPFANRLICIDYEYLTRYPLDAMRVLTRELDLPAFPYRATGLVEPD